MADEFTPAQVSCTGTTPGALSYDVIGTIGNDQSVPQSILGWFTTDASISLSGDTSVIPNFPSPIELTEDGQFNPSFSFDTNDGHCNLGLPAFFIDKTVPEAAVSSLSQYYNNSTFLVPFTLLPLVDNGSGVGVDLYYRHNSAVPYTKWPTSSFGDPLEFVSPDGDGSYQFIAVAFDEAGNHENIPTDASAPEFSTVVDTTAPMSSAFSPTNASVSPIRVVIDFTDGLGEASGVAGTQLFYRHNGGGWVDSGLSHLSDVSDDTAYFDFVPVDGDGTYDFYTITIDEAGNVEVPPIDPDATTLYDTTVPVAPVPPPANNPGGGTSGGGGFIGNIPPTGQVLGASTISNPELLKFINLLTRMLANKGKVLGVMTVKPNNHVQILNFLNSLKLRLATN